MKVLKKHRDQIQASVLKIQFNNTRNMSLHSSEAKASKI